ncbi:MAG: hypothetical protein ABJA66_03500 [Actinomycetota bacterium]
MNKQRWRQFSASFLIVLSLFVSSVSACVCSHHHTEKVEIKTSSCHEHSGNKQNQNANSSETLETFDSDDKCCCVESAPKIFSKSETIKIEKQTAVLPFSRVEIKAVSRVVSVERIYFEKPFYLSDSFYNIKSPRAPPRL